MRKKIPCEICGFDKITELHHIIKRQDYGDNSYDNLVFLCPNHHKMADSLEYEDEVKELIKINTGKVGKKLTDEQG